MVYYYVKQQLIYIINLILQICFQVFKWNNSLRNDMVSVGIDNDKTDEGQIKKYDLKRFDKLNIKYYKVILFYYIISCVVFVVIEFVVDDLFEMRRDYFIWG